MKFGSWIFICLMATSLFSGGEAAWAENEKAPDKVGEWIFTEGFTRERYEVMGKLRLDSGNNTKIAFECWRRIRDGKKMSKVYFEIVFDLDTQKTEREKRYDDFHHISVLVEIGHKRNFRRFRWYVQNDRIEPFDKVLARSMFNAGVRGDTVKLTKSGKTRIDVDLPEMNDDFRMFARACPITNPS